MASLAPFPWLDVAIILVLVAVNGLFSMSELAIVSARKARLEAMARARPGRAPGARAAILLAGDPGKFLSTVQIGITLIAVVSGAFSGASLGEPMALRLERLGLAHDTAHNRRHRAGHRPDHLCLARDRRIGPQADRAAPSRADRGGRGAAMRWIAVAMAPLVWLLDSTSGLLFRLNRPRSRWRGPGHRRGAAADRRRGVEIGGDRGA